MNLTYAKMLAIVMRENMKLGDNTLNNERLTFENTRFLPKYWRIVALILLPYNINNLETKGSYKRTVNLKNLIFLKKSIEWFKNHQNVQKPLTKAPRYIDIVRQ